MRGLYGMVYCNINGKKDEEKVSTIKFLEEGLNQEKKILRKTKY